MKIDEIFELAKSEVIVIGVVGISSALRKMVQIKDTQVRWTIIAESENHIYNMSLISDTDIAINRRPFATALTEQKQIVDYLAKQCKESSCVTIQISYVNIPIQIISVDGEVYVNDWRALGEASFKRISPNDEALANYEKMVDFILSSSFGGKYCSPYKNKKGEIVETIEAFDHDRIRRGIFPRSSFYDSDLIKLVVWRQSRHVG